MKMIIIYTLAMSASLAVAQCEYYVAASATAPPVNHRVDAIASYDPDGSGPLAPRLLVGGSFASSPASTPRFWDGTNYVAPFGVIAYPQWSFSTAVQSMALFEGRLIVGGGFTSAGGVTALSVAQWSGTSYAPLGAGLTSPADPASVRFLGVAHNTLYAAGSFDRDGLGVTTGNVVRWAPALGRWSAAGGSPVSGRGAYLTDQNYLYAALTSTSGTFVSRFNGVAWEQLGGSFGTAFDAVGALAFHAGELHALGTFTSIGGASIRHLAKYNGSSWVQVAPGINFSGSNFTRFYAMTSFDGKIIIGGQFTRINGAAVNNIAAFNGSVWSTMSGGVTDSAASFVNVLVPYGDELLIGGVFSRAGNVSCANIASAVRARAVSVVEQPENVRACNGSDAVFTLRVDAVPAPTYRWRRNGVLLSDGTNASGATVRGALTPTLEIAGATAAEIGTYSCVLTHPCGVVISAPATLTLCAADVNCDGGVDGSDVESFFTVWQTGQSSADFNGDGGVDGADVESFYRAWMLGC
jgi:hypothetical protein